MSAANSKYSHRAATKTIKLSGADGNVLRDTEVIVEQTNHKFLFGCSQFDAIPYVNNMFKDAEKERAEQRFEKFLICSTSQPYLFIGAFMNK